MKKYQTATSIVDDVKKKILETGVQPEQSGTEPSEEKMTARKIMDNVKKDMSAAIRTEPADPAPGKPLGIQTPVLDASTGEKDQSRRVGGGSFTAPRPDYSIRQPGMDWSINSPQRVGQVVTKPIPLGVRMKDTQKELDDLRAKRTALEEEAKAQQEAQRQKEQENANQPKRDNDPLASLNVGANTQARQNNALAANQPYNMGVGAYTSNEQKYVPDQSDNTGPDPMHSYQGAVNNNRSDRDWEMADLDKQIAQKEMLLRQLERTEKYLNLSAVTQNEDFARNSRYRSTAVEGTLEKATSQHGMGYGDLTYEYINDTPGVRNEVKVWNIATHGATDVNPLTRIYHGVTGRTANIAAMGYEYMKPEEVKIYNYLYRCEGKETAEEYLGLLQEELNRRKGGEIADWLEDKPLLELGYGVYAGMDQFADGVFNAVNFTDDYIPVSAQQFASQEVREDLYNVGPDLPKWLGGDSLGEVGYDLLNTTGNMLPAMLLEMALPGSGAYAMGVSAGGNAYQSMLNEGYTKEQARAYGALMGAAEVSMEKFLNGIPQMGKSFASEKVLGNLAKLDNVFGRVAKSKVGQMFFSGLSESVEEPTQSVVENMLWSAITGEEIDIQGEELLYDGLIAFMSGGSFKGLDILTNPGEKAGKGAEGGKAALPGEPSTDAAKSERPGMELLEGFDIHKSEVPVKTEEQQRLDAAMKEILGVEKGGIDTETTVDYNNIIKNEGENYGQKIDDRTAGVGDSAQGMAGVQPGDRPSVERGQEHGGVAGNSGVLRLSTELQNAREKRGLPSFDLYDTSASPQEYERALVAGRNSDAVNGWCVTPKSAQELAEGNVRTAMNADHTVGVGVAPDGDIVAVFKNRNGGPRKALDTAMPVAIEMGGDRLDCYGEGLVRVYEGYGFIPVARVEFNPEYANDGWTPDKGQPYIYVMMHNGDSAATVTEKMHSYKLSTQAELDALPTYGKDAYDEAMRYRDQMMQGRQKNTDASGMAGVAKGNDESVGAATRGFTGKEGYYDLLTDENSQPDRPGDVRPMEVLKTDRYGRRVSEFAANAYGAEVTPDNMADTIQELIDEGALGFDTRTNKESLEKAAAAIGEKGMAATERAITKSVMDGKVQDGDIEKAMILYAKYANKKSNAAQERAAELMVDLATMANMTGRNLQMFKLLRKMTPEGQLMTAKKEVQRTVEKMQKSGKVKKDFTPEVDPKLEQEYLEAAKEFAAAEGEEAQQKAKDKLEDTQNAIYQTVAAQVPATFRAKWDAWRYMAMLGNVKTQVRNIVGNLAFRPYVEVKRALGTAVEKMFVKKENRTKALMGPGKADRALMDWAKNDAKTTSADALKYSAKLGDDVSGQKMREGTKVFDSKLLEGFRKITEAAPAKADLVFKNWEYTKSLAGFLKARGFAAEDVQAGKVDGAILEDARNYAIREAMKATFNDANAFSDFMSMRFREDNAFKTAANIAMDGVLPFRRTPANIVVRMKEYSPVEIGRGVWNLAANVRSGKVSAATAIDQITSGLTGTGAIVLGWAMANGLFGIRLRGSDVSDEEKEQGHQPYSLEFYNGGELHSYKIDWCAPANLPLFIGANICDSVRNGGGDTNLSGFTSTVYAMGHAFEPMLSLSCLSSLNDLFQAGRYAGEGEAIYSVIATMATSYLTQGIPALVRQADQAAQENETVTFANHEDPLIRGMQRTAANLPFVGRAMGLKVDKVNEDGETVSRGEWWERGFNAFVNPGTHKVIHADEVDEERQRLSEKLGENVSVPDVAKTITFTDSDGEKHENYRLTGEEYTTFQQVQGQTQNRILGEIVESDNYEALTDEQKAKVFGYVYDYAREMGRTEAIEGYPGMKDAWMEGIEGKEADAIVEKVVKGTFDDAFSGLTECWKNGKDDSASVEALEEAYQVYNGLDKDTRAAVMEDGSEVLTEYVKAREDGITSKYFAREYRTEYMIGQGMKDLTANLREGKDTAGAMQTLEESYELYELLDEDVREQMAKDAKGQTGYYLAARNAGIDTETFAGLYQKYREIDASDDSAKVNATNWAHVLQEAVENGDITQKQANRMKDEMMFYYQVPANATNKYNELVDEGISAEDARDLGYLLDGLEPPKGYTEVRDVQKLEAVANFDGLTRKEKDIAMKMYMPDYDPKDKNPDKTELRYDYARQEMGLTAEEYVEVYQAHVDNDKKAEKIAAWMELGYSRSEANQLWRLFGSAGKQKIDVVEWHNGQ